MKVRIELDIENVDYKWLDKFVADPNLDFIYTLIKLSEGNDVVVKTTDRRGRSMRLSMVVDPQMKGK